MQCSCGGQTRSAKANNGDMTLVFERCASCGRIGSERLIVAGVRVAEENKARAMYQEAVK